MSTQLFRSADLFPFRRAEAQRKEGNVELQEAWQELYQKDAELAALQSQSAEFKKLQDLLEGWETNTGSGAFQPHILVKKRPFQSQITCKAFESFN